MNLVAFKSTISRKLEFQLQQIVDANMNSQKWLEMLYRPQQIQGNTNTEQFFKSLTSEQKVDLDQSIFNQLPYILATENPKRLSINLMPISLLDSEFRSNLRAMIYNQKIDCGKVCIEIVETHSMPALCPDVITLLQHFRSLGGWIALDDFGSGSAHWELLQMGLIDVIKVANQNLIYSNSTESFTQGLVKFAESMKINTVLEGVETQEDLDLGLKQGYKNFQGWYFNDAYPLNGAIS